MFISAEQLARSLNRLSKVNPFFGITYLTFKKLNLPIGSTTSIIFSNVIDEFLEKHFRVTDKFEGFYQPFSAKKIEGSWVSPRYASTSLQRTTVDAFGDTIEHPKGSYEWGWVRNYVQKLGEHLRDDILPAFDLAVWFYRQKDLGSHPRKAKLVLDFFQDYGFSASEIEKLFEISVDSSSDWISAKSLSESDLLELLGPPPGLHPTTGTAVHKVELTEVGPAAHFVYEPAERLNIITGDNSLGKTFLLETLWWALTRDWLTGISVRPRRTDIPKSLPRIRCELGKRRGRSFAFEAQYDWQEMRWLTTSKSISPPSPLVIYARFDGSFAVCDPARTHASLSRNSLNAVDFLYFSRSDIWEGLTENSLGTRKRLSNGLIQDFILWQSSGEKYSKEFNALNQILETLSPDGEQKIKLGKPVRLGIESHETPTIEMPYGDVPIPHSSAAMQRVIGLAYMVVWTWHEHLHLSELIRRPPQRQLVLIIDEIEAHLHPRWQRLIVPALMQAIAAISSDLSCQIHIATHSPLVLASVETVFDEERDDLHHLTLDGNVVRLEELTFSKQGPVDAWLTSEVFGLAQPRSMPGELAILRAKALQLQDHPSKAEISEVHKSLLATLAQNDEFWPRWRFFADKNGVLD